MPGSYSIYKAGKLSFLLVCLFLCTACNSDSRAVFQAGKNQETVIVENVTEEIEDFEEKTASMININTADVERLMTLPGIGESKARDIIAYRQEHGDFASIEELMNVSGIKENLFEKVRDKIIVN